MNRTGTWHASIARVSGLAFATCGAGVALAGPNFNGPASFWKGSVSTLWSEEANWACSIAPCVPLNTLQTAILGSLPTTAITRNDLATGFLRNVQVTGSGYRVTGNALTLDGLFIGQAASDNRFQLPVRFQRDALLELFVDGEIRFEDPVQVGFDASGPLFIRSQGLAEFAEPIQGPGGLTVQLNPGFSVNASRYQPGRLRLLAPNGFVGRVDVGEGFLQLAEQGTLGDTTRETVIGPRGQLELARPGIISGETLILSGDGPTKDGQPFTVLGAIHAFGANHLLTGPLRLADHAGIHVAAESLLSLSNAVTSERRELVLTKRGPGILELAGNVAALTAGLELAEGQIRLGATAHPAIPRFTERVAIGGSSVPAALNLSNLPSGASDVIPNGVQVILRTNGTLQLGRTTEAIHPLRLSGGSITGDSTATLALGTNVTLDGPQASLVGVATMIPQDGTTLRSVDPAAASAVDFAGTVSGGLLVVDGPTVELRGPGQNTHVGTHVRSGLLRLDKSGGAQPHHRAAGAELIVGIDDLEAPAAIVRCQDTNQFHPTDAVATVLANGLLIFRDAQTIAGLTVRGGVVSNGFLQLNGPLNALGSGRTGRIETEQLQLSAAGIAIHCAIGTEAPITLELRTPVLGGTLTKEGPGVLQMSGPGSHASNSVAAGTLRVNGDHAGVPTRVRPGARVAGTGSVGPLWLASTAAVELGASNGGPGILTVGNLDLARSNTVSGTTAAAGTDRLRVNGTVTIGNDCRLLWGFSTRPALGERIVVLQNDGSDPIAGRFANAPDTGSYTNQGMVFLVQYDGGTGNDLSLEFIGTADGVTNRPPVLGELPDRPAVEGDPLAFTIAATDPDPGQTLRFSVVGSLPPGATLDAVTGAFAWTPGERQGGRTFEITVRVTDDALPTLSHDRTFRIAVAERNQPPTLAIPDAIEVLQGETLSLLLAGSDADLPAQVLSYTLVSGAAEGMTLQGTTGRLRWAPDFNRPSSTNTVRIRVQDDRNPPGIAEATLSVIYRAVNRSPVPAAIADQVIAENGGFDLTLLATDPETPAHLLAWEFAEPAPTWFHLSPQGQLTFIEAEEAGPSTNTLSVRVRDNGTPQRSATASLVIVIREINRVPELAYASIPSLSPGTTLSHLPASFRDADQPSQPLTLRLLPGAPAGLTVDPLTGRLSWTVPENHPATSYSFGVVVTDDPGPTATALGRTNLIQLTTVAGTTPTRPTLRAIWRSSSEIELRWDSTPGTTYRIQQRPDATSGSWSLVEEVVASSGQSVRILPTTQSAQFFRVVIP